MKLRDIRFFRNSLFHFSTKDEQTRIDCKEGHLRTQKLYKSFRFLGRRLYSRSYSLEITFDEENNSKPAGFNIEKDGE